MSLLFEKAVASYLKVTKFYQFDQFFLHDWKSIPFFFGIFKVKMLLKLKTCHLLSFKNFYFMQSIV